MRRRLLPWGILCALIGNGVYYEVQKLEEYGQRPEQVLERRLEESEQRLTVSQQRVVELEQYIAEINRGAALPALPVADEALIIVSVDGIGGKSYKFPIPTTEYFRFKQMTHRINLHRNYVDWVTYNNPTIRMFAEELTKGAKSSEEAAQRLLDFVHRAHVYDASIEDDGKEDYVRYPIETIVERNGDCEDLVILAAALMKSREMEVALIDIPAKDGEKFGHLALGVQGNFQGWCYTFEGKDYFYAEATGTDWKKSPAMWKIGQIPKEYETTDVTVHVVR